MCLLSEGQRKEEMELSRIEKKSKQMKKARNRVGLFFENLLFPTTLNTVQLKTERVLEKLRTNTVKQRKKTAPEKTFF